ncbi:CPBP family intramembrane glutamic endopeptidase [Pseudoteredinibacter isoporae]|uniref:CPBP family intramembrane glutamic endopeptidase n=1 Tax=Pseudoteredinibacter isoporae TaxID=570281 RepID=UPI003101EA61
MNVKVPQSKLISFGLVIKSQLVLALLGFVLAGGIRGNWQITDLHFALYGALLAAGSFALLYVAYNVFPRMVQSLNTDLETYGSMIGHFSYPQLALIGVLAGLSEEWLFRAFLQDFVLGFSGNSPLGSASAIIVASLGFAALHGLSRRYFLFTFAMGLALGYAYQYSGSLLMVILWHSLYDVIALCWLKRKRWRL